MARCPFATWRPISGSCGPHLGGPFKIVHHTTEGSTAQGAMDAFRRNRSDPHFTVDATTIFQHVDTAEGARALRNDAGGVQTNRDSAVQIELVGFAHLPKDSRALTNVARLCRWIEEQHGIPRKWPSGRPLPAKNGKDPGGHNRDPAIWDSASGHFGHCHVPENSHWDPAYSAAEADFILAATFSEDGALVSPAPPPRPPARRASKSAAPTSTMPDHGVNAVGIHGYLNDLAVQTLEPPGMPVARRRAPAKRSGAVLRAGAAGKTARQAPQASINAGSVLSFAAGLQEQERGDVLYSLQLAQRAASAAHDRFTQSQAWYQTYVEVLENLGWTSGQMSFTHHEEDEREFRMDQVAVDLLLAVARRDQLAVLDQAVTALGQLAEDDDTVKLFDFHASSQSGGNFQLGAVQRDRGGGLSMALGAYYFRAVDSRKRFLFAQWGARQVNFWACAQRLTLNAALYEQLRDDVEAKLAADAPRYIASLKLAS
ncbi:peptidoglycan recognition protein family protein [Achromobacter sp. UBA2119]|uniref:peptidoglycan recognition protein family protein n=1 Tax=Achromobacter sp. UBA2119 TaxID=1945911 RepID=UPI00257EF75A|nr:peptidoglycan recognition family protein [Achromobacter sp. UBA2119]